MKCAVTGQDVVTGHYVQFTADEGVGLLVDRDEDTGDIVGVSRGTFENGQLVSREPVGAREEYRRVYALESPPPDPGGQWAGTKQTGPASLEQVAEDISRLGKDGMLFWNPKEIRTPDGRTLKPVRSATRDVGVRIPIKAGTASEVAAQIRAGGPTRVSTTRAVEGLGMATVELDVDVWPPFAGI